MTPLVSQTGCNIVNFVSVRYFLKYENDTEYYRALCLLFFPFRNEFKDIHSQDVEELYKKNENTIEEIRVHFEKHRDFIEKMKEIEENKKNEDSKNEIEDKIR